MAFVGTDVRWFTLQGSEELARVASDGGVVTFHNRPGFESRREHYASRQDAVECLKAAGWKEARLGIEAVSPEGMGRAS